MPPEVESHIADAGAAPFVRQQIINLLKDSRLTKIRFTIGNYKVDAALFRTVATAIERGKIKVVCNSKARDNEYDPQTNTIISKYHSLSSKLYRAVMIHEAAHAGWDLIYKKRIKVTAAEAAGYLAQVTWYNIEKNPVEDRLTGKTPNDDKLYQIALELAQKVLQGKALGTHETARLESAVHLHSNYSKLKLSKTYAFDG